MKLFAGLLSAFASLTAISPSSCCILFEWDEPECPKSLLD